MIGELQPTQLCRMAGWLHAFTCLWYHYELLEGQVGGPFLTLSVLESTGRGQGHCSREMTYCWSPNFVLVDRDWLTDRLSPPIRCAPGTDLVLLIAYMCPYSLEINISSSFFLHFWQGDRRKSQDLA